MSDSDDLVTTVTWLAVGLGVAFVAALVAMLYCCCKSDTADDGGPPGSLLDGLLRRDQLENTLLENGGENPDDWQCVVCAYSNGAARAVCVMCGTSAGFLVSTRRLTRLQSSGALLGGDEPAAVEEDQRARQRALFKRRMNSLSLRKDLSQRQRGAIRRRLWERKLDADGKFHWVRQNSTDAADTFQGDTARAGSAALLLSSGGRTQLAGPLESVADYHNLRSQGFVWQYDELGQLVWKKAEDVAIDMESFSRVQGEKHGGEKIDFEGIMAMDFRVKKQWFLVHLSHIATPITQAVMKLPVTRENMLEETLVRLTTASPEALHTYLKISFAGEPGIDAGGLLREWFTLVCKELFSDAMGLFVATKGEDTSYWIDPLSGEKNARHLQYFRLAGVLVGKALFEGLVLDVHLALPLLKHVLGVPISFSDLQFLDEDLHRNSTWLKTNADMETYLTMVSQMEIVGFGLE
ncbi:hypothetical protein PybrP1_002751 [[Pythium] brassicae (nom. inval.)]|nr:hypothetical protein PybrP1_002751 [[Pythium] brassicae (nom. inval.)]